MEEFPSNSKRTTKKADEPKKDITPIVSSDSVNRKKAGLGRRMSETFLGGDARSVGGYIFWDVAVPAGKSIITDMVSEGIERLLFGESRPRGRRTSSIGGGGGSFVNYGKHSTSRTMNERDRREIVGRPTRHSHSVDDVYLASRHEADEVLEAMYLLLEKYEIVTVADLYRLLDEDASPVDARWGWASLQGSDVRRARGGDYQIILPAPDHIRD